MLINYFTYKNPKNWNQYFLRLLTRLIYLHNAQHSNYYEIDKKVIVKEEHKNIFYTLNENEHLIDKKYLVDIFSLKEIFSEMDYTLLREKVKSKYIENFYFFLTENISIINSVLQILSENIISFKPVFEDSKYPIYRQTKLKFQKKYESYFDLLSNLLSSQFIVYEDYKEIELLNLFLSFAFPEYSIVKTDTNYIAVIIANNVIQVKPVPKVETLKKTNFILFLVPSFEKECGVSEYHLQERKSLSDYFEQPPVVLTYKKIQDIMLYTDKLYIHHEINLFDNTLLAENIFTDLENYIKSNPYVIFNIFIHYAPPFAIMDQNFRTQTLGRILKNDNVQPIVFTDFQKNNLTYSARRPIIQEHGFYQFKNFELDLDFNKKNTIVFFGFNSNYKNLNQEFIIKILKETSYNLRFIGKGTNIFQTLANNNFPKSRIQIYDSFYSENDILDMLKTDVLCGVFNGTETSSIVSGAYRFFISTGIPVIAKNSSQYTSIKSVNSEYPFYDNYDNLINYLNSITEKTFLGFVETAKVLVEKYPISKQFYDTYQKT